MAVDKFPVDLLYESLMTNNNQLYTNLQVVLLTNPIYVLLHVTHCKSSQGFLS